MVNVGKYTIHGSCGHSRISEPSTVCFFPFPHLHVVNLEVQRWQNIYLPPWGHFFLIYLGCSINTPYRTLLNNSKTTGTICSMFPTNRNIFVKQKPHLSYCLCFLFSNLVPTGCFSREFSTHRWFDGSKNHLARISPVSTRCWAHWNGTGWPCKMWPKQNDKLSGRNQFQRDYFFISILKSY